MTLGEKISELRKQNRLSQEELAEKLNVSRQSVSLWETNQTVPQIDYLMELSKIFNVSLDELCNNKLKNVKADCAIVDNETESAIVTIHLEYTEQIINKLIKYLDANYQKKFMIWLNVLLIGLLFCFDELLVGFLIVIAFLNIIFFITYEKRNKQTKIKILNEKRIADIKFYKNYIDSSLHSTTSILNNKLEYKNITKLYIDDEIALLVFDNKYVVVELANLEDNKDFIISKIKLNAKKTIDLSTKNNSKLKKISLILFIGCFASILIGLIMLLIAIKTNQYSFVEGTFVLKSWVFFIAATIPFGSFIFGLLYNSKIGCKKNIIAGIIIASVLCIYGSFCFIFKPFYKFNDLSINELEEVINTDFPSEYLSVEDKLNLYDPTYIKFINDFEIETFEKFLASSTEWNSISNFPDNIDITIKNIAKKYDDFYIYEFDSPVFNNDTDSYYDKLVLFYNYDENILVGIRNLI